ncbi:MAG: alpha/beta fold hydrolase [Candidatus Aenigmatarchaeota archaeon]
MQGLDCELVRLETSDDLELQGLLFKANRGRKAVIHIHGWTGNFYEDVFIDYIAKALTNDGMAFLTFNTRGSGHVQEFLKGVGKKRVMIGGSLERFEDCIKDIGAALNFMSKRGFKEFILQGHSTGCQKIVHYYNKTRDSRIRGLIFLEPTDDPPICSRFLGNRYNEALVYAKKMVMNGAPDRSMPDWLPFGIRLSAQKFLSMSDPTSTEGRIFSYSGNLDEIRKIDVPVLAVHGAKTEYQDKPGEKLMILKKTVPDCETNLLDTNHWFSGQEKRLGETIVNWIKTKT